MVAAAHTTAAAPLQRRRIAVRGAVQGVGFRPFVYRQATSLGLAGWVSNTLDGVVIEAQGGERELRALVDAITTAPPPHAVVTAIEVVAIDGRRESGFAVRESSVTGTAAARLLPDLATCDDCVRELFDPADRRHRYPFIACTQCGPRYSIVESMPYDRVRTAMRRFAMCAACQDEYDDPASRRFHAEVNACAACGPQLALWSGDGGVLARADAALAAAADALRQGRIVAVKGIGGFHLLVDARDDAAVRRLRAAKRRAAKPFAVMFPDRAAVTDACRLDSTAAAALCGPARPIVLLPRLGGAIAASVAPESDRIGALLPYAPLHHLLLDALGFPVVATSGNVAEEPIVTDEREALVRLRDIAEVFLVHDRPIARALDDSVVQTVCGTPQILRSGRGYAPSLIAAGGLPDGILGSGGHLKATIALTTVTGVVVSQHLGDQDSLRARDDYGEALQEMPRLHRVRPRLVACDAHPHYATRRAAEASGLPLVRVQHHAAHIAACMADNAVEPPALGVAWDGTGYGDDGTVWGGEFLVAARTGWQRVAHLRPFPLPGGEAAIREPRRAALGLLFAAYGEAAFAMTDLAPLAGFGVSERAVLRSMLMREVNAPLTTSAGRLFDAFAALCGICQRADYEGQAAARFEAAADGAASAPDWTMPLIAAPSAPLVVDWAPALAAAIAILREGGSAATVAAALHASLAAAIAAVARHVGERQVVLSGGCFQNRRLTEAAVAALAAAGFAPFWHRRVPPNDGGIAVGQAMWAAWQAADGAAPCA